MHNEIPRLHRTYTPINLSLLTGNMGSYYTSVSFLGQSVMENTIYKCNTSSYYPLSPCNEEIINPLPTNDTYNCVSKDFQLHDVIPSNVLGRSGLGEQKEWDRGRWVGPPKGCKQHGCVFWSWMRKDLG